VLAPLLMLYSHIGGIPPQIYADIGGADYWIWFITGNLLGSAAICPFSGALSDLLGRRYVAIFGMTLVLIGQIVCAAAPVMDVFIGMCKLCSRSLSGSPNSPSLFQG
jgi:MFS family permease